MWRPLFLLLLSIPMIIRAQEPDSLRIELKERLDSMYIAETEHQEGPAKVLHAEPLYIDLIRDLGARKGEKEWNFGFGLTDNLPDHGSPTISARSILTRAWRSIPISIT